MYANVINIIYSINICYVTLVKVNHDLFCFDCVVEGLTNYLENVEKIIELKFVIEFV